MHRYLLPALLSIALLAMTVGPSSAQTPPRLVRPDAALAQVSASLRVDGIAGDSAVRKGEMDLVAYRFGAAFSSYVPAGPGDAAKPAEHQLVISKVPDSSTPKLLLNCLRGTHLRTAILTVSLPGGRTIKYTLLDVTATSVKQAMAAEGVLPVDEIALDFTRLEMEYSDGQNKTTMTWDLKTNTGN